MRAPKRIFYSLLILLLWLGFVVDGTHALFSSSAVLAGNTINSGTASLLVSNSQNGSSTLFDAERPGFDFTLVPGETDQRYFFLKNVSTGIVDFDLGVSAQVSSGVNFANRVDIGFYPVDDNGTATMAGYSATLAEISANTATGLVLPSDSTQRYILRVTLHREVTDQGAELSFGLTFTGTQHLPTEQS